LEVDESVGDRFHLYALQLKLSCAIPDDQNTRGRSIFDPVSSRFMSFRRLLASTTNIQTILNITLEPSIAFLEASFMTSIVEATVVNYNRNTFSIQTIGDKV